MNKVGIVYTKLDINLCRFLILDISNSNGITINGNTNGQVKFMLKKGFQNYYSCV